VEVPPEYRVMEPEAFFALFSEGKFLRVLQIWTEHVLHDYFPETLNPQDFLELMIPTLGGLTKLKEMNPEEREKLSPEEIVNMMTPGPWIYRELDPDEADQFSGAMTFGFLFFTYLEESGADWRYSGNGVQLGEWDREILRYRPPDSRFWRVVYGDLDIEEVPAITPAG
jgi:hypothetical protein